jgi:hypothetical protein
MKAKTAMSQLAEDVGWGEAFAIKDAYRRVIRVVSELEV